MLTRITSGIIAAAMLIFILVLPQYVLAVTVFIAGIIALYEFSKAMKQKDIVIDLPVSIIASILITGKAYGSSLSMQEPSQISSILTIIFRSENLHVMVYLLIVYLFCSFIFNNSKRTLQDIAYTLFGIVYIPFLLSFIIMTRNLERGFEFIWIVLIGAFATDIFAYFVGVSIGKNQIIPHISPKKTVEGSIGGAIGCMVVMILYGSIIINRVGMDTIPLYHLAIIGFLCGIVAQIGDWAASAIKRYTGIKDFGNVIPGHGGIMDRVDSILFVAPLVYIYISQFMA